jgi:type IV secretory pathway TrbF-like protein
MLLRKIMDAQVENERLRVLTVWLFRFGIAACAAIIVLAAALTILALRPRVPPYVIELNNGRIEGYAHPFPGAHELGPMLIEQQLRQFIYDARVVSANGEFVRRNMRTVYAIARGQASRVLNAYYAASPNNDPVQLGRKGDWREVNIFRCLREPQPNTYRVEWSETLHPQTGDASTSSWEATMQIAIGPPDTGNELNPTGLYVVNLDLQEAEMK